MEMREQEGGMSSLEMRLQQLRLVLERPRGYGLRGRIDPEAGRGGSGLCGRRQLADGNLPRQDHGARRPLSQDGPPDLVVLAEDALQAARMKRRTKNWDSTTLTAIAQQVATNLGLTPVLAGLDANIGTQQQFNESDLRFLRRLLARYDADVQIVGAELHASPRSQAQRNSVEIDLNSQLREVRVIADLSHQVTQITATGWDYTQGQRISVTSQPHSPSAPARDRPARTGCSRRWPRARNSLRSSRP